MDGILVDSEPYWQDVEMEIFSTVGLQLTRIQCMETMGLPVEEVVEYRFKQHPWEKKSREKVTSEIADGVEERIRKSAVPLAGVPEALEFFRSRGIPMALASSSSTRLINAVLTKLSLENIFRVVHSAEHEKHGKPDPAVFLTTARLLKTDPSRCLVFEDSFNGLKAAKTAGMKTVVIPTVSQWNENRFDIADLKLKSLAEFKELHWNKLNAMP